MSEENVRAVYHADGTCEVQLADESGNFPQDSVSDESEETDTGDESEETADQTDTDPDTAEE